MILIDHSTGSKDLINYPPLNDPATACKVNLSISSDTKSSVDVAFSGQGPEGKLMIGIEFKSLSDLLSSIEDGRLPATQLRAMKEEYQICYLLFYGEYRCGPDGYLEIPSSSRFIVCQENRHKQKEYFWYVKGIPYQGPYSSRSLALSAWRNDSHVWEPCTFGSEKPKKFGYLESALISMSRVGIEHKHFDRIEDCAQWIGCVYRSWSKPWDEHKFFRTFDKSSDHKSPALMPGFDSTLIPKLNFAKELPGMGFERALSAAKHFENVIAMANANVNQWLAVEGVGKVVAKAIVEWVNRKKSGSGKVAEKEVELSPLGPPINLNLFSGK